MFDRRNLKKWYIPALRKVRNFFLSPKSKEFLTFLFFVFVAFCFWLLQTLNDVYQVEFRIPVRLRNVPKEAVITSHLPDEVRVRVEDRGTVLLNYMMGRTFLPLSFDFADYRKRGAHVYIPLSEVSKKIMTQLNTSTRVLSIKPDTLGYIYTVGIGKRVPVRLQGHVGVGQQYYVSEYRFKPDSVMVYAPVQTLDTITAAFTRPVNIENVSDTTVLHTALQPVKGAKFLPSSSRLSILVDMYAEKTVDVAVVGLNFPPGKMLRTFPSKVQVTFAVGLKHFNAVSAGDFFIGVTYEELLKTRGDKVTLHVKCASPYADKVRAVPAAVDYLIEQQAETPSSGGDAD